MARPRCPGRYEADETPMVEYLNASNIVEQRRRAAREAGGQGPRTIVRCSSAGHLTLTVTQHYVQGCTRVASKQHRHGSLGPTCAELLSAWQAAVWP